MGAILLKEGDISGAKEAFQAALALQPDLSSALAHLAEIEGEDDEHEFTSIGSPSSRSCLTEANALEKLNEAVAAVRPYPGSFEGRGIVIPGGGARYFPCAWICIRTLREQGCCLPIELWHLGPDEMSDQMRRAYRKV